jgi:hypothetical protein
MAKLVRLQTAETALDQAQVRAMPTVLEAITLKAIGETIPILPITYHDVNGNAWDLSLGSNMYPKGNWLQQYLFNIALGLDQFINVLLLGDTDDSISGRCGRAMASGKPKWFVKILTPVIDWLFLKLFNDEDHCKNSIESEESMSYEIWSWHK